MVKIRLMRKGKKHDPHFRIVVQDSRHFRSGKVLEEIGFYNTSTSPSTLKYNKDSLEKWIKAGAQLSDTVHDIFVKEKVVKQDDARVARIKAIIMESKKKKTAEGGEVEVMKPEAETAQAAAEEVTSEATEEQPKSQKSEVQASAPEQTPKTEKEQDAKVEEPKEATETPEKPQ